MHLRSIAKLSNKRILRIKQLFANYYVMKRLGCFLHELMETLIIERFWTVNVDKLTCRSSNYNSLLLMYFREVTVGKRVTVLVCIYQRASMRLSISSIFFSKTQSNEDNDTTEDIGH